MKLTEREGGCHCGRVRFRVRLPIGHRPDRPRLDAVECNCSMCRKKGFLHVFVEPRDFALLSGSESLDEYRFNTRTAVHRFCRHCGVHPFYIARSHPDHVDVNLRCLDDYPDLQPCVVVSPFDGANWEAAIDELCP